MEPCDGAVCPLWEEGGAVLPGGCALERLGLELERAPAIAGWLLYLRDILEGSQNEAERAAARRLFSRLLSSGARD